MKAAELRIGNLVQSKINGLSIVEQLGSSLNLNYVGGRSLNGQYWENSYLPIQLTEEWLIKLGFEKTDNKFKLDNFRFHVEKPCNYDGFIFCENYRVITDKIHHVHQLQNLFWILTGEELKLKP